MFKGHPTKQLVVQSIAYTNDVIQMLERTEGDGVFELRRELLPSVRNQKRMLEEIRDRIEDD